jgi:hypothetical protein
MDMQPVAPDQPLTVTQARHGVDWHTWDLTGVIVGQWYRNGSQLMQRVA